MSAKHAVPSRDEVRLFLEGQGYEYLGPSLPEDPSDEPPEGPWQIVLVQVSDDGPVGMYRVRGRTS